MPDFFEFKPDNEYIRERLTQDEIDGVVTWQSGKLDYQFSFHTQHEAGWPCYLSEPDGPGRNLPKINLKVPTNPPALLQGDSVRNNRVGEDFRDVIRANVALFQKLAEPYYEGEEQEDSARSGWVVVFECGKDKKAKPVTVRLPAKAQSIPEAFWSNFKGFAQKPNCPLHRNAACLEGKVQELPAAEVIKVTKRYDENGEIQELT